MTAPVQPDATTTPQAPAQPAAVEPTQPAAPPAPPAPAAPAEPRTLSLSEALARRRQAVAAGLQPRTEGGQFAGEAPDGTAGTEGEPALDAEGQPIVAAEPGPDGAEGGEGSDGVDGGAPEFEVVPIPGMRAEDPPFEMEVSDPVAAERLRQLNNGFMRGEEVRSGRREIAEARAELQAVETEMEVDPIGFVRARIPATVAHEVALQLLADPEVLERARSVGLEELLDPDLFESRAVKIENRRYQLREQVQARQASIAAAQRIEASVRDMVPDGFDEELGELFVRDSMGELAAVARARNGAGLRPEEVPALLQMRRRVYGIPDQPAGATRAAAPTAGVPAGRATPAERLVARARPRQPTGAELVSADQRRRQAAAAAPAGSIAPVQSGGHELPPGTKLNEALKTLKDRLRR